MSLVAIPPLNHLYRCICRCTPAKTPKPLRPGDTPTGGATTRTREDEPVWLIFDPIQNVYVGAANQVPTRALAKKEIDRYLDIRTAQGLRSVSHGRMLTIPERAIIEEF